MVSLCALAGTPVRAQTTGVVFAAGGSYVPGDQRDVVPIPLLHVAGGDLVFTNFDTLNSHSVTSKLFKPGSFYDRLFDSGLISFGKPTRVVGVEALAPGRYQFECILHDAWVGAIDVV